MIRFFAESRFYTAPGGDEGTRLSEESLAQVALKTFEIVRDMPTPVSVEWIQEGSGVGLKIVSSHERAGSAIVHSFDAKTPAAAGSIRVMEDLAWRLKQVQSVSETETALKEFYDSTLSVPVIAEAPEAGGRPILLRPSAQSSGEPATVVAPGIDSIPRTETDPENETRLPLSYRYYLAGIIAYFVWDGVAAVLTPIYALRQHGLAFAALTAIFEVGAMIPGSVLGAKLVRRFDSRLAYIVSNALIGVAFLALPLSYFSFAVVPKTLFLAYNAVFGLAYGASRGVAEMEIVSRIVGQRSEKRLRRAGFLFFIAMEPPAVIVPILTAWLLSVVGPHWIAAVAAISLLVSAIPFFFIRYEAEVPAQASSEEAPAAPRLREYLPFVFFRFVHMTIFWLLPFLFAVAVFGDASWFGPFAGSYSLGSFLVSLADRYRPHWISGLSLRRWLSGGVCAVLGFLWGTLILQSAVASVALICLTGVATTAILNQAMTSYRHRLPQTRQPEVFQWLNIVGAAAALVPLVLLGIDLQLSLSLPMDSFLIAIVSLITLLGIGLLWMTRESGKSATDLNGDGVA